MLMLTVGIFFLYIYTYDFVLTTIPQFLVIHIEKFLNKKEIPNIILSKKFTEKNVRI